MKTAIYYSGTYGSTRQYAQWLQASTGFPLYDTDAHPPSPQNYDRLILGTSIIVGRPRIKTWLYDHWDAIQSRPTLLFTVSGTAPGHPDITQWMEQHLNPQMREHLEIHALRGRLDLSQLPFWLRFMLRIAGRANKDPETRQRMTEGFDYMDRASLEPILSWANAAPVPA